MRKLKHLLLLIILIGSSVFVHAQILKVSPFHHLLPPQKNRRLMSSLSNSVVAYRFVLPFAGYSLITQQMSTGVGYGYNKMHWVDSTFSYYVDLSIFGAIFLNGNVTPTPYNFTSVGLGAGLFNDLVMIVPGYNIPLSGDNKKKGGFDIKIVLGLTLK